MNDTANRIEGAKPQRVIQHVNLGNGFASYALVNGTWYSVNMNGDTVQDVRWIASDSERTQLIAVLGSRAARSLSTTGAR